MFHRELEDMKVLREYSLSRLNIVLSKNIENGWQPVETPKNPRDTEWQVTLVRYKDARDSLVS